jgi:hypothetical protein
MYVNVFVTNNSYANPTVLLMISKETKRSIECNDVDEKANCEHCIRE